MRNDRRPNSVSMMMTMWCMWWRRQTPLTAHNFISQASSCVLVQQYQKSENLTHISAE